MALIPAVKRLLAEDFKDQPWIAKLLGPINDFFGQMSNALNKRLTFTDNFAGIVKTVEVNVLASNTYPIYVKCGLGKVSGLWIIKCEEVNATIATVTSAPLVHFEFINNQIKINDITGLTVGKKYNITLVIIEA
jgi:hypothetical protein